MNIYIDIQYAGNMNTVRYACHLVTIITDNVYRIFALVALMVAIALTLMKNLTQKAIHVTCRRVDITTTRNYCGATTLSKKAICTS